MGTEDYRRHDGPANNGDEEEQQGEEREKRDDKRGHRRSPVTAQRRPNQGRRRHDGEVFGYEFDLGDSWTSTAERPRSS